MAAGHRTVAVDLPSLALLGRLRTAAWLYFSLLSFSFSLGSFSYRRACSRRRSCGCSCASRGARHGALFLTTILPPACGLDLSRWGTFADSSCRELPPTARSRPLAAALPSPADRRDSSHGSTSFLQGASGPFRRLGLRVGVLATSAPPQGQLPTEVGPIPGAAGASDQACLRGRRLPLVGASEHGVDRRLSRSSTASAPLAGMANLQGLLIGMAPGSSQRRRSAHERSLDPSCPVIPLARGLSGERRCLSGLLLCAAGCFMRLGSVTPAPKRGDQPGAIYPKSMSAVNFSSGHRASSSNLHDPGRRSARLWDRLTKRGLGEFLVECFASTTRT